MKLLVDIIVVGGGHAGVEAVHAALNRGLKTALVTLDPAAVARMSCNPAIGGLAKGQIVREMDVLGGLMPKIADQTGLQFKMLNRSKGRSVWSPRAQIDKRLYEQQIQAAVFQRETFSLVRGEVVRILVSEGYTSGVVLRSGESIDAKAVVLTCGTFLNGLIHIGERKIRAGRMGEPYAAGITEFLASLGFHRGRLKTGTPPRLIKQTVDWAQTAPVFGDNNPTPFSYGTRNFEPQNIPCYQTKTTSQTHSIVGENIHTSPLFSGDVSGVGPRYCPSIEDKIHRFPHQSAHTLFLEPEWKNSDQIYINGFSTSLPENVQLAAIRAIPGFENACFFRPGYAIEYDFFPPSQLKASLESKAVTGLFLAGQINGTSGYEEAGVQGLIAGANAAKHVMDEAPVLLDRSVAYAGVLIDDLITKDTLEPYRMFTSRAEYRLLLRYSNSHRRLADLSFSAGLIDEPYYERLQSLLIMENEIQAALGGSVLPEEINPTLSVAGEAPIKQKIPARSLLKRPEVTLQDLPERLFQHVPLQNIDPCFRDEVFLEVETSVKYEGYIRRQLRQVETLRRQESYRLPTSLNYHEVASLSLEAREKLTRIRPETLGQAMRISGVTPADISVLSVLLARGRQT